MLREAGVSYTFDSNEMPALARKDYQCLNIETGIQCSETVYLTNADDIYKLLNHWNRYPEWKYWI